MTYYPNSNIRAQAGDVLFTGIGRSTYFVGHAVIMGTDGKLKEALPGTPAGHELTIKQLWRRHNPGDKIILMRPKSDGDAAADWATKQLPHVKKYTILNCDFKNISNNYCFKFIAQAYYYGANQSIIQSPNHRLITPFEFKTFNQLEKTATFLIS